MIAKEFKVVLDTKDLTMLNYTMSGLPPSPYPPKGSPAFYGR